MKKRLICYRNAGVVFSGPFFLFFALLAVVNNNLSAQQLAFPGAEGFGRYSVGGRGGAVYHVTNLNDAGPGSFRDAVSQPNRTVVFEVGGVINITTRIVIQKNVTIAGQTAPGGGITIYGNGIALNSSSGNNIIRYIRFRMGKNGDIGKDAISISDGQNYIFDNVSISWGRDGTLDVNGSAIDNLTFQDCIISQGINNTNHSTGGLMQSGKWSMIRSLYIDNKTRNPKAKGQHEFINSVLYNWQEHGYIMGDTEGLSECNLIGNYFIYGPSSNSNTHITGTTPAFNVYVKDNWIDADKNGKLNGVLLTDYKTATVKSVPYSYPGVINQLSAQDALDYVINNVGASRVRDAVDNLLISQLTSYGTKGQIINTEDDNGIPGNVGTVANGTPPVDTDRDGMPDHWEIANGLNPNDASDRNNIGAGNYTMLEIYLNALVDGGTPNIPVTGVSVSPTSATVNMGATTQLTATVAPLNATNKNVSWGSNNTSVATVSSTGLVSGVAAGSATITVTTQDGSKTATCAVTVTQVTDPLAGYTFAANEKQTFTYTGTVDIAYGANGKYNYLYNQSSGSCACTNATFGDPISGVVKKCYTKPVGSIAVTGVSVTPTSASVNIGATTQLTATVAPSNATNKTVSWGSNNTSVATVSSTGLVSGVAAGSATITVTTQDGSKTATCAVTVTQVTDPLAGYTFAANEKQTFTYTGTVDIAYGANGKYNYLYNQSFGRLMNFTKSARAWELWRN
ncbi:MAG: Ig-like domain-containing protein [Bacteroidales bacterium]